MDTIGTGLPLLHVHMLDTKLSSIIPILKVTKSKFDSSKMSLEWCHYVDGVDISPKLTLHLRLCHKKLINNQMIQDKICGAQSRMKNIYLSSINCSCRFINMIMKSLSLMVLSKMMTCLSLLMILTIHNHVHFMNKSQIQEQFHLFCLFQLMNTTNSQY